MTQETPVDTGERLAAYLAGDLDTDEQRALEAELAGDAALRARLARLRRLEDTLQGLPEVEPPAGFSQRLDRAVRDELAARPLVHDELAARRERRRLPGWLPAAAGAAAVLAVVVGIGTSLSGLGGSDDSGGEAMTTMEAPEAGDGDAAAGSAAGPTIVDEGRSYDRDAVQALAADDRFAGIVEQELSAGTAADRAEEYREQLRASDGAALEADEGVEESADGGADTAADAGDDARTDGPAAVARCIVELLVGEEPLIPVYAELATFEGAEAIVYGIVSRDPAAGTFTRVEVWVVDRATCEVVFFTQDDR